MKLIEDWRQGWRWWSVRTSAIGAILSGLALALPDSLLAVWHLLPPGIAVMLPQGFFAIAPLLLFVGTLVSRFIRQREDRDAE